ncbi:type IX secretion system outer membrane channel protein PorV [Hymenobacter crusticola]|uniref:Type IX secretion system protein PorV domain-containing protein n=1 Tax=Hymenobacter crusticola TaxID=1770526 RepID=A0A243WBV4_9BACT|nr:type IX secretion system outer membrane channel protein PorV [Hymenobacter crusticola]OUJ72897.1 hypothetical protein BXP70_16470 [Hymenobacter crusticola]
MVLPQLFWRLAPLTVGLAGAATVAAAQQLPNTIITAVPFLRLSPDARSAALGQAGVALTPDANAAYYNAGRLSFIPAAFGVSASYLPRLRTTTSSRGLASAAGYGRLSQRSVVGASVEYFDTKLGGWNGAINSEYAISASYGYRLNEYLGVGTTVRYIQVNLSNMNAPSQAAAMDLGLYYTKDLHLGINHYALGLGAALTNVGDKMTYTNPSQKDFLPTTLKVGGALTRALGSRSTLTFAADVHKLLVPTPYYVNGLPANSPAVIARNQNLAQQKVFKTLISTFSDAPGGFREEVREIMLSTGLEYAYNNTVFVRAGYYYESPKKGDLQYASVGVGAHYRALGLDGAYLVPNTRQNPLAQTLRLSLHVTFGKQTPSLKQSS